MEHDELVWISLSNKSSRLKEAPGSGCLAPCNLVCLPFSSCLPEKLFICQPFLLHNSPLSIFLPDRTLRSFLPACSCALVQFVCLPAHILYRFPACLPDLLQGTQLFLNLLCNFYDLSVSLLRHITNQHAGPHGFYHLLQFVCLVCILDCFVCEAGKCRLPAFLPACLIFNMLLSLIVCLLICILHSVSAWCYACRQSTCLHALASRLHATHFCLYLLPCMLCSFIVFLEASEERHL